MFRMVCSFRRGGIVCAFSAIAAAILVLSSCPVGPTVGPAPETLVINHGSIDLFDRIPAYFREEVKKRLLILPGESHGRGYAYGLYLVGIRYPQYRSSVTWSGSLPGYSNSSLRYSRSYYNGNILADTCGEAHFYANATERSEFLSGLQEVADNMGAGMGEYGNHVYAGFAWCWDMTWHNGVTVAKDPVYGCGWAGSSENGPDGDRAWGLNSGDRSITGNRVSMQTYLDAVDFYNSNESNIRTIFTTGPVDDNPDSELGYQRHLKHEYIRDYVRNNGGILLDYADILSWDYENNRSPGNDYWTDGNSVIHQWRGANRDLATGGPGYSRGSHGGCHVSREACILLGQAIWVMLALDAGWVP